MNVDIDFETAGEGLLEHAREAEVSPRGKIAELFPYIWEASRRLSTRAISRFLSENHGIKLSAVSVAKALKTPEKYWEGFAEVVEPHARIVAEAHNATLEDVLYIPEFFEDLARSTPTIAGGQDGFMEYDSAYGFVCKRWYSLSLGARECCYRYIVAKIQEESEENEHE